MNRTVTTVLAAALLAVPPTAGAQEYSANLGLMSSSINDDDFNRARTGLNASFHVTFGDEGQMVRPRVEFAYMQKGGGGIFTHRTLGNIDTSLDADLLQLGASVQMGRLMYGIIGPYLGVHIACNAEASQAGRVSANARIDCDEDVDTSPDLGLMAGIGWRSTDITLEIKTNLGFTDLFGTDILALPSSKVRALMFSVGYVFR